MGELLRRLRYLLSRRRRQEELASDMEFHREMAAGEGGPVFGNTLRLREEARDAWGWTWIDRLWQDLSYAARVLRKSPSFTITAILMLALGIGVNVAVFGFFNLVFFKPLPVREPDTLRRFLRTAPQSFSSDLPYPEMAFFREHSSTLSAVLGVAEARLAMEGEQERVRANFVTANIFHELGAETKAGRLLDQSLDEKRGDDAVAVLGYGFWRRHFGGDPSIAGKIVHLNGSPVTIVGVVGESFTGPRTGTCDLWLPITAQPRLIEGSELLTDFSNTTQGVQMWGRLRPGVTPRAAEDELRMLAAELRKQHPNEIWKDERLKSEAGGYINFRSGHSSGTSDKSDNKVYSILGLLAALTLLILLVACGNLGSLLLARGVAREREISIRTAIGASRGRLVRQLFTESILLALAGAAAGLALGYGVLRLLLVATDSPSWFKVTPDWRVVLFALSSGFLAAILFGLTPARQIAYQRHRATIVRQFLVGAQIAGSTVLLIVAGLLVRALDHALTANLGFEYQQVVSIHAGLNGHGYSAAKARAYLDELKERLYRVRGVESVSLASAAPLGHTTISMGTEIEGRHFDIQVNHVDPTFFRTMRIPMLRGRNLRAGDTRAMIISDSLARQWPTGDALGKEFTESDTKYIIVGICGNARLTALEDPDGVEGYFLAKDQDLASMDVLVRAAGPPEGLVPFLASLAKTIDPKVFPEIELVKGSFRKKLEGTRYSALVVSLLGSLALVLACLGIIGLVAYAVSQGTKEIGIRMALGAKPFEILSVVLSQFAGPLAYGLPLGIGVAAALSQLLRRQLYGISNLDPLAYAAAISLFVVTVLLAAMLPARRALHIDPLVALRYD